MSESVRIIADIRDPAASRTRIERVVDRVRDAAKTDAGSIELAMKDLHTATLKISEAGLQDGRSEWKRRPWRRGA